LDEEAVGDDSDDAASDDTQPAGQATAA